MFQKVTTHPVHSYLDEILCKGWVCRSTIIPVTAPAVSSTGTVVNTITAATPVGLHGTKKKTQKGGNIEVGREVLFKDGIK